MSGMRQERPSGTRPPIDAEIVDSRESSLRALGKNERWLHDWLIDDPTRLGLGPIAIKAHELIQAANGGGRLDILGYDASDDTYYEIEVMLGECDASHGFRTLDYWARERATNPDSRHVAVLVAENLQGRYKTVLETLPQFLPFIGIEIHTLLLVGEPPRATIRSTILHSPDDLLVTTKQAKQGGQEGQEGQALVPRDEETWRAAVTERCWRTMQRLYALTEEEIGPTHIDYSSKSYVGLWKGRRCWCPMWPRQDGVYIYLPDGGIVLPVGGDDPEDSDAVELAVAAGRDQPSARFARVKAALAPMSIDITWAWKYNAGANPVGFGLRFQDLDQPTVREVLRQAYGSV